MEKSLGTGSPGLQKFLNYQLRSFVESNALTRWCPGRGCERVACAESASAMESEGCIAHCDHCSISFCLVCGEEPHAPCPCKELATWNEKCRNESETANWILANTKSCPKCVSRIEKNQGCNHMTCTQCRHHFCWQCMSDWNTGHVSILFHCASFVSGIEMATNRFHFCVGKGYQRSCNAFELEQAQKNKSHLDAKRELERYLHCLHRYHNHRQGQDFAEKSLREFVEQQDDKEYVSCCSCVSFYRNLPRRLSN